MDTPSHSGTGGGIGPVIGGVVAGGAVAAAVLVAAPALLGPAIDESLRIVLAITGGSIAALLTVVLLSVAAARRGTVRAGDAHPDAPPRAPVSVAELALELADIVHDEPAFTEPPIRRGAMPLEPGERIETFDLGGDPTLAQRMLARMAWESRAAA